MQELTFQTMREGMHFNREFIINNLRKIILTILIVIFSIGIIIKFSRFLKFLKFIKTNPTFYLQEKNALVKDTIPAKDIKTATYTKEFTFNAWLNIDQYSYKRTKSKMIFCMVEPWSKNMMKELVLDYRDNGDNDGGEKLLKMYQYPGVWFEPLINNIKISMVTKDGNNRQVENCFIPDIPIKEWFLLSITLSSRGLDTYINGKLVRTIVLQGDPIIKQGNLLVNYFGGYSGSIQKLQYSTRAFLPKEVQKVYECGRMTSFIFDWFFLDRCRGVNLDPTAPSEKCSNKINGFKFGTNKEMWYLPDNICDNFSENFDWENAENTNNTLKSNGPEIGRDISCIEIEKKYKENELLPLYNKLNNTRYLTTTKSHYNNQNQRSGLNYNSRKMDYN